MKRTASSAIFFILLVSGFAFCGDTDDSQKEGINSQLSVTVYYFHREKRCSSCRNAEAMSFEAVEKAFPVEMKNGSVAVKSVAVDGTEEERALAKTFGAFGPSLYLFVTRGESSERINLDKMWPKIQEGKEAYQAYVVESISRQLKS
ncbi:MAG TPA: nitrophenyl compound nitroreductase subunit ArsF family protein [Thermoanaerobaculia bacterium]|nr:nitrophenyl compound nitroreductase subunit ArsF family protein [Thermoanaerobaculia bacterium]HUM30916.1 nitrophenyl compound nitroreductase subunit ArsF family protein [Thermoanaerobaculia bacterium]HXK69249.1 nitrophenyl compound nitroreductase subunit ArsF family protein [Thermoanaerobaculia bacterium]